MPALGNMRLKYLEDMVSHSDIARALEEEKVARKGGQRNHPNEMGVCRYTSTYK